jgi:NTP pyrophosphatase (non-canonical NTP hydrolase)
MGGQPPSSGARLLELAAIVSRLQAVCPWTKEQSAADMLAFTREELTETEEALAKMAMGGGAVAETRHLESELGDVLFDAMMLIEACARDHGTASLEAVCEGAVVKLRRRAPYAFEGGPCLGSTDDAARYWQVRLRVLQCGLLVDADAQCRNAECGCCFRMSCAGRAAIARHPCMQLVPCPLPLLLPWLPCCYCCPRARLALPLPLP